MALKQDDSTFSPTTYATAVIGSGTIGSRIALMLASGGGEVRLYDPNADQLEAARRYVEAVLPCVGAGRPGALPGRLVVSFSQGPSKPPLLTLGWLWKRYQSGWISRKRCLGI